MTGENVRLTPTSYINKFEEDNYEEIFVVEVYDIAESDKKLFKWAKEETVKERSCNFLNLKESFNLILEKNISNVHTIKWIENFYPNMNVTCLENVENQNELRCGFRSIWKNSIDNSANDLLSE